MTQYYEPEFKKKLEAGTKVKPKQKNSGFLP